MTTSLLKLPRKENKMGTRHKDDYYGNRFDDLPLFDRAYARKTDPVTSHEAAEKITPHLGTIDDAIYKALLEVGERGATSDEIVKMTDIKYRSVTPRLKPMCKKGLVVDSGECRNGDSGRRQIIWRAI